MRAGEFITEVGTPMASMSQLATRKAGAKQQQSVGKPTQGVGTQNAPTPQPPQPSTIQQDIKNIFTGKTTPQPKPDQQIGQPTDDLQAQKDQEEAEQAGDNTTDTTQKAAMKVGNVVGQQTMVKTIGKPPAQLTPNTAQTARAGTPPPGSSFNYPGLPGSIKVLPRDSSTPDKEQGIQIQIPQLPGPLGKQKFNLQYKNLFDPNRNPDLAQDAGNPKK